MDDLEPIPFRPRRRRLWPWLAASALLHLASLLVVNDWGERVEDEAVRVRLLQVPRFEPRRPPSVPPRAAPGAATEDRGGELRQWLEGTVPREPAQPQMAGASREPQRLFDLAMPAETFGQGEGTLAQQRALAASLAPKPFELAVRADTFRPEDARALERRALAATLAVRDSMRQESLDLLRVGDLALGRDLAVVLADPNSRRDVAGFLTLRRVRLRGGGGGQVGLDALARYLRERTALLVQVPGRPIDYFVDEDLLRDPIHFLVEDGGLPRIGDWPLLQVNAQEKALLERYLRRGGLLFFEGSYRYLTQVTDLLRELLGASGGLRPLPVTHPLYHAFYDFDSGFPGEIKSQWEHLASLPPSWSYPGSTQPDVSSLAPANLDPSLQLTQRPDLLGLWGVEVEGQLVAILSDLELHRRWANTFAQTDSVAVEAGPALFAGTNLLVYAMTRQGSLARRRALPAWARTRPRVEAPATTLADTEAFQQAAADADPGLETALDASLALVRAPLGTKLGRGGVSVRVDGRYKVDLPRESPHGVILHNLPPGAHWVELGYAGQVRGLQVELLGGKVATVTFGVSRLAMLRSIHLRLQEEQVGADDWHRSFADLVIEEVFLGDDGSVLKQFQ